MTKRASFEPSPYRRRLLFEPLEDRRLLSITVNTLVDENDGIAVGGISLRDAIAAASPGDTINFAPSLTAAGPATILLTHGELAITKSLAINGPGASLLTIDASGNDPTPYNALPVPAFETSSDGTRVFRIDDGNVSEQDVSINGLKISGGDVPGDGGGILNYEQLAIVSCEISNNIADGSGGGIANRGDAVMTRCTLANDASRTNGGGASNTRALTILSSEVFDNRFVDPFFLVLADGRGGGIFTSGSLTITRSTISGNSSIRGGGISATGTASVSMFQSTLSNNYAGYDGSTFAQRGAGGGVYAETGSIIQAALCTFSYNHADAKGAGLFLNYARLSLTNCTITGNSGSQSGAGLYIAASDLAPAEISYATISSNRSSNGANGNTSGGGIFLAAGNLHIVSTIIAQNMADDGPDLNNNLNALFDSTYCLVGDGAKSGLAEAQVGSPDAKGNLVGGLAHGLIDPHLSSLADHGGPTWTMFLLSGSPAIDTGNPVAVAGAGTVPQFDQRGAPFSRVAGGRIDIGATERQTVSSLNLVVDTLDDESDGNYTSGDLSLREAIGLANGSVGTNTVSFALSLYSDGPITIALTLGVLKLDESATILSPNASLISLDGSKNKRSHKEVHDVAQGAEAFEIVQYYAFTPVQVEIDRLTITKFGAQNFSYDAAIQNSANVTISGCNITNNFNIGIRNFATLGITDSTISNNMAQGIINDGQCAITSSTISGNITDSAGGGIFNSSGSMTITDSTISGNQAKYSGGGIYSATNLIATNVTISSNSSSQNGGGIFLGNSASFSPIINLSFCSISNNFAALGGGLFLALGAASLNSSIVADNYYGIAPDLARLIGTDITTKYCLIGSNAGSGLTEAPTGSPGDIATSCG
jgi:CSLREA domain-containing protein